jgi:hypothetical protein
VGIPSQEQASRQWPEKMVARLFRVNKAGFAWGKRKRKMSDDQPSGTVMDRLAQVDGKLEKILDSPGPPKARGRSKTPAAPAAETGADPDMRKGAGAPGAPEDPRPQEAAAVAGDTDSILKQVGGLNRDVQLMTRLDKLERQNRKIVTFGSLFMTLMILVLGVSTFLIIQANFFTQEAMVTAAPQVDPPKPAADKAAAKGQEPQTPVRVAEVHVPQAAGPSAPAGDPKPAATPAVAPAAPKPAKAAAPVKYVGYLTSHKYHLPSCKYAKDINRYHHRTFSSVEEARAHGYVPCPTCNPPSHD